MNCPSFGSDISAYKKNEAERKARQKKEEEFERTFGHILRPIRRKRNWKGGITGAILMLAAFMVLEWFLFPPGSRGAMGFLKELKRYPWFVSIVVLLVSSLFAVLGGMFGLVIVCARRDKREREFRKAFGF